MSLVLDASMAVTWLFQGERTEASHRVLERVGSEGARLPSIWRLEVATVLRNAVRRRRCKDVYAERSLQRLARLPIVADEKTDARAWSATYQLARDEGLTPFACRWLPAEPLDRSGPTAPSDRPDSVMRGIAPGPRRHRAERDAARITASTYKAVDKVFLVTCPFALRSGAYMADEAAL